MIVRPARRVAAAAMLAALALAWFPSAAGAQAPGTTRVPALETADKALAAAVAAVQTAPSAVAHERVAALYVEQGILDAAFGHYQAALKLHRRSAAAHEGLARIWRDWGFNEPALAEAYRALFYAPQSASAHNTLGTVLMALGRLDDARAQFVAASTIDPAAGYVANNLCVLALKVHDYRNAVARCERAQALDPSLTQASNNLGFAYAFTGNFVKAHASFARVGTTSVAAYNLGLAYASANRLDDAALALRAAAIGAPWSTEIAERLRQVNRLIAERAQ